MNYSKIEKDFYSYAGTLFEYGINYGIIQALKEYLLLQNNGIINCKEVHDFICQKYDFFHQFSVQKNVTCFLLDRHFSIKKGAFYSNLVDIWNQKFQEIFNAGMIQGRGLIYQLFKNNKIDYIKFFYVANTPPDLLYQPYYKNPECQISQEQHFDDTLRFFEFTEIKDHLNKQNDYYKKGEPIFADFMLLIHEITSTEPISKLYVIDYTLYTTDLLNQNFIELLNIVNQYYRSNEKNEQIQKAIQSYYLNDIQEINIKSALKKQLRDVMTRSAWSNLAHQKIEDIDHQANDFFNKRDFSLELISLYDKQSYKIVQAGCYASRFFDISQQIIKNNSILKERFKIDKISIIGYTNRNYSSVSISTHNQIDLNLLNTFQRLYITKNIDTSERNFALEQYLNKILSHIKQSFETMDTIKFDSELESNLSFKIKNICKKSNYADLSFQETLQGADIDNASESVNNQKFVSTSLRFRQKHTEKTIKILNEQNHQITALLGHPGIGKTHSLLEYCKTLNSFLCVYFSPRIVVNEDFFKKIFHKDFFQDDPKTIVCKTNASILSTRIEEKLGDIKKIKAVYNISDHQDAEKNFYILSNKNALISQKNYEFHTQQNQSKTKGQHYIRSQSDSSTGVVSSTNYNLPVFKTSIEVMNEILKESNQSFDKIFYCIALQAYREQNPNQWIRTLFNKIDHSSNRLKTIIFFVDEVTGSSEGYNLFSDLLAILPKFKKEGYDVKLIVADASLVNAQVLEAYFAKGHDISRIFYDVTSIQPNEFLTSEIFKINDYSGMSVNANSFPAQNLTLQYDILLRQYIDNDEELSPTQSYFEYISNYCISQIQHFCENKKNLNHQFYLFVQNKKLIDHLVDEINQHAFFENYQNEFEELITVLTSLEHNIDHIHQSKIFLVTSTASRGITLPNVTHLLILVPNFQLEQNLMEILQAIYRGRGFEQGDENVNRTLQFAIDYSLYFNLNEDFSDEELKFKIYKHKVRIYNILFLLKSMILSRINGGLQLKNDRQVVSVPIGEKLEHAYSQNNFLNYVSSLQKDLEKLSHDLKNNVYFQHVDIQNESKALVNDTFILKDLLNKYFYNQITFEIPNIHDQINLLKPVAENLNSYRNYNLKGKFENQPFIKGNLIIFPLDNTSSLSVKLFNKKDHKIKLNQIVAIILKIKDLIYKVKALSHNQLNYYFYSLFIEKLNNILNIINDINIKNQNQETLLKSTNSQKLYLMIILPTYQQGSKNQDIIEYDEKNSYNYLLHQLANFITYGENIQPYVQSYKKQAFVLFESSSFEKLESSLFNGDILLNHSDFNLIFFLDN